MPINKQFNIANLIKMTNCGNHSSLNAVAHSVNITEYSKTANINDATHFINITQRTLLSRPSPCLARQAPHTQANLTDATSSRIACSKNAFRSSDSGSASPPFPRRSAIAAVALDA
jgi:hypothetical protein